MIQHSYIHNYSFTKGTRLGQVLNTKNVDGANEFLMPVLAKLVCACVPRSLREAGVVGGAIVGIIWRVVMGAVGVRRRRGVILRGRRWGS